jgi:RHS repeat-associated protein
MGYSLTTSLARPPARSHASPKTHVPGSRLQERGHRFYSTDLSRWISRDPIGERGGSNLYSAMGNRPLDRCDPFGLTNDPGDFGWPYLPLPPEFGGNLDMLLHYLFGNGNGTWTQDIIDRFRASQDWDVMRMKVSSALRDKLSCNNSGVASVDINDKQYVVGQDVIPSIPWLGADAGRWQVRLRASCFWGCGRIDAECCCQCRALCSVDVTISKHYTFAYTPDGNPLNRGMWLLRRLAWLAHLGGNPDYDISTTISDRMDIERRLCRQGASSP